MLVARIGPELDPLVARLDPADLRIGRLVALDRESGRQVDEDRAAERMHPVSGAQREAAAARHAAQARVPAVDLAVQPLGELLLVGDAAHLGDEPGVGIAARILRGVDVQFGRFRFFYRVVRSAGRKPAAR